MSGARASKVEKPPIIRIERLPEKNSNPEQKNDELITTTNGTIR